MHHMLTITRTLFQKETLEALCFHRCGSYVIEQLAKLFNMLLQFQQLDMKTRYTVIQLSQQLNKLCSRLLSHFIESPFANHVLRQVLLSPECDVSTPLFQLVEESWADDPKKCGLLSILFKQEALCTTFLGEHSDCINTWARSKTASFLVESIITHCNESSLKSLVKLFKHLEYNDFSLFCLKPLIRRLGNSALYRLSLIHI